MLSIIPHLFVSHLMHERFGKTNRTFGKCRARASHVDLPNRLIDETTVGRGGGILSLAEINMVIQRSKNEKHAIDSF